MAALKPEVKAAIVQMLACYDTPSQVVEAVQKDFGIAITRQQVETHDPTKVSGKTLAKNGSTFSTLPATASSTKYPTSPSPTKPIACASCSECLRLPKV